jgi:hypothetical protein
MELADAPCAGLRQEFVLSNDMLHAFRNAESRHDAQLRGWVRQPDFVKNRMAYAAVIRAMALERVIRDFSASSLAHQKASSAQQQQQQQQ